MKHFYVRKCLIYNWLGSLHPLLWCWARCNERGQNTGSRTQGLQYNACTELDLQEIIHLAFPNLKALGFAL